MTTSNKVEQFYNALVKDPELDIKPGQTREQAARMEASYRARQYDNNAKALAMATTPDESPINSLFNHLEQMKKSSDDIVLLKQKPLKSPDDYSNADLNSAFNSLFNNNYTDKFRQDAKDKPPRGWAADSRIKKLSEEQKQNLKNNLFTLTDNILRGDDDTLTGPEDEAMDAINKHVYSLPLEEKEKVFQTLLQKNPVTVEGNNQRLKTLRRNGYLLGNSKRISPLGFAHVLATNEHGDFNLPSSFNHVNLTKDNYDKHFPKTYINLAPSDKEVEEQHQELVDDGTFENTETSKKWFTNKNISTRKNLMDEVSALDDYYNDMGKKTLTEALIDEHISNYDNAIASEVPDFTENEALLRQHDPDDAPSESVESKPEPAGGQTETEKTSGESEPLEFQTREQQEAEEEAARNQRRQKVLDNYKSSGDRIILEQKRRQNQSDYKGHKSSLIEKLADKVESGSMTDDDYSHLHGYSFSGYNNSFQSHLKNQSASLENDFKTFVSAYSPSFMGDKALKKPENLQTPLDAQDYVEITNNSGKGPSQANVVSGRISAGEKFEGDSNPSNPDNLPIMHGNYEQSYTDENNKEPGWRYTNGSGSGTFTDEDYIPPPGGDSNQQAKDKSKQQAGDSAKTKSEATSPEDDLINTAKESGVFDYLYAKTHGTGEQANPFGSKEDFEEELRSMGADKLRKKLRDEHNKMTTEGKKIDDQEQKQSEKDTLNQQKADAKIEKRVDSIINSKSFLDKNIMDYINAVGPYESKSNQTDVAKKRRSTLMYQKLMGDLHQISKAGKITRATADKYDAAAAKLIEIGADAKKAQNQYTEFVNKGELTVAGQKVTDFGSEEHMNLLEADFQGLKGDEAKNYKGHFNQYGPVAKLREIDPEGKFWGGPKETQEAPEKPTSTDATGDEDYEGSDIPNEFRGYGTPPEGVRTYKGPQGGMFYDRREVDDSEGSPSIFGGKVTPQQYGEAIIDTARAAGQAEIDAGKAVGRGVVAGAKGVAAGAKGVAGAATAGAKKIKETGAKVGRAFTDPSPSPVGAGEMFAGTVGGAGKAVGRAAGRVAGAAAKGAKAAKTQVSESVGADVARGTAGAAKEGATKVAGATAAGAGKVAGATAAGAGKVAEAGKTGASKVAQAGKAGIGRITGTGKKGAGKVSQAGKTASERLREFVSTEPDTISYTDIDDKGNIRQRSRPNPKVWEQTGTELRRKPGKTMSQRFSDLFKADDIENPEGLARWLAAKYDGVPTTTKPGEKGWERIQTYLTALRDPSTQERRGKVNRTLNRKTGKTNTGPLYGSRKKKAPQSHKQRARTAMENHGWNYYEASNNRFNATNKPPTHSNHRRKAGQTVADKRLGNREDFERKHSKRVARTARQAGRMAKQMPSDELLHKQRQDILERLEKLV
tara:strand:- start:1396 stop:5583 length:4188 start_codon:yes stop_codon:yes gene_type:complete